MFSWFRKRADPRVFPDARSAFAFACTELANRQLLEALIPALVEERDGIGSDGEHYYRLTLADKSGGQEIRACTLKEATEYPVVGELVGFRIVRIADELPEGAKLIGYIACQFDPVYVPGKGWRIARNLTPPNIRQTIRW